MKGKGTATFNLVDTQTKDKLASVNSELTDEYTVISCEDLTAPTSTPVILSLEATTGEHEVPITFLSLAVTMTQR